MDSALQCKRSELVVAGRFLIASTLLFLFTNLASASLYTFSGTSSAGKTISGSADFSIDAVNDKLTIILSNTTPLTTAADELFTGLDFTVGGLTPTSLTSATGVRRSVNTDGTFTDSAGAQNLIPSGSESWSLDLLTIPLPAGTHRLEFHPDAKDAIIGPPSGGNYSAAGGSITTSPGHDPFVALTATFVMDVPGLEANTSVEATVFRYNTGLGAPDGKIIPPTSSSVPEPSALLFGSLICGVLGVVGSLRRWGANKFPTSDAESL